MSVLESDEYSTTIVWCLDNVYDIVCLPLVLMPCGGEKEDEIHKEEENGMSGIHIFLQAKGV